MNQSFRNSMMPTHTFCEALPTKTQVVTQANLLSHLSPEKVREKVAEETCRVDRGQADVVLGNPIL